MIRVRHTINTPKGVLLQFRNYMVTANKVEIIEDSQLSKRDTSQIGKWLCTFRRPKSVLNKPKIETSFINSKKKIIIEFRKFILSDFPKSEVGDEENPLIKATNGILNNVSKLVNKIRKEITDNKIAKVNTLINHTFLELNTLQSKIISKLESPKK